MKSRGPGFAPHPGQPLFLKKLFRTILSKKRHFFEYFLGENIFKIDTTEPPSNETNSGNFLQSQCYNTIHIIKNVIIFFTILSAKIFQKSFIVCGES
jgi:hypothetical protein